MKIKNINIYFGLVFVVSAFFINFAFAQVIQPQALNLSGFPTISLPTTATVKEINDISVQAQSSNHSELNSLGAAGLPTIRPMANVSIADDGNVKIKNAVVFQIAGSTFFVRTYWGETFLRWTIRSDNKTQIIKRFNGLAKSSDIAVGHVLNIDGSLLSGSDTLNLNSAAIRDLSLENENGTFSGKVTKIDPVTNNVTILTSAGNNILIKFDSGAIIKKGAIYLQPSQIVVGDKIISVSGSYHEPSQSIEASSVEIYQEQNVFIPHNFQGTLKNLSGTTLPATFTLVLTSKAYNVFLSVGSTILKTNKSPVDLKRFVEGDTVRVYGKIRETDLNTIDAEVVRNISL